MAWAGALEGIFLKFANDFNAHPLNMYMNFRSLPHLLRMQNEIIKTLDPNSIMDPELLKGAGGDVAIWEYAHCSEEAISIAQYIENLIEVEGIPHSEIAILISKQLDLYAEPLMQELQRRNIPFRNEQNMQDISSEPIARLIIDYLLCIFGDREPEAWSRLMEQIIPFSEDDDATDLRHGWSKYIEQKSEDAAFDKFFGDIWPKAWSYAERFLEKVGQSTLIALSSDYEAPHRLRELIDKTRDLLEKQCEISQDFVSALKTFFDDNSVRILTIHKSKGLEFEIVIMMTIEEEIFFGNEDENLCALFVGVSRAKRQLILTHTAYRETPLNASPAQARRWSSYRTPNTKTVNL